ncbi:DUF488 domain-containing protein [Candidatus Woesearchaeota archaeon]|nr:DUF488 domain-containing protein [Candidatus Woesearchaeota archaeon]
MPKAAYLIGHGNMKAAEFVGLLNEMKVDLLVDVRSVPFSRYVPEFNEGSIRGFLAKDDIEYVHMGNVLGGRRNPEWFAKYLNSEEFTRGMALLRRAINGRRAAIMCSEIDYGRCHRRFIGLRLADEGFTVEDISRKGIVQRIGQRTLVNF